MPPRPFSQIPFPVLILFAFSPFLIAYFQYYSNAKRPSIISSSQLFLTRILSYVSPPPIRRFFPLSLQHSLRDAAFLRYLDGPTVVIGALILLLSHPRHFFSTIRLFTQPGYTRNIKYGPHQSHLLDIYYSHRYVAKPSTDSPLSAVIIFMHGGAWQSGSSSMYCLVGQCFDRELKVVTLVINYRTYPMGTADDQCADIATAVEWARENISQYGGDKDKIIVCGHSSGAHILALMLIRQTLAKQSNTLTPTPSFSPFSQSAPLDSVTPTVRGYIGISGVYDIASHYYHEYGRGVEQISPMLPACGGNIDEFTIYSPSLLAQQTTQPPLLLWNTIPSLSSLPPTLLVHGQADSTVPFTSSTVFAESLDGKILYCSSLGAPLPIDSDYSDFRITEEDERIEKEINNKNNNCICVIGTVDDHSSVIVEMMMKRGERLLRIMKIFINRLNGNEKADTKGKIVKMEENQLNLISSFIPFTDNGSAIHSRL